MVCIYCGGKTRIYNSRSMQRSNNTWRRRVCTLCDTAFTTIEAADYSKHITVRSQTKTTSEFNRDRLLISLHASLQHRADPLDDAVGICETVVNSVAQHSNNGMLTTTTIRETVITVLKRFDALAAQHYSAMHPAHLL